MEEFNKLLNEYKNQYLQFLSTGDQSYRVASEKALEAIEQAVTEKREQVDSEKAAMKHFAATYQKNNEELESVVQSAKSQLKSSQEIHDEYQTSKTRYDSATATPSFDPSVGYSILVRIGIVLILLPILALIGFVFPSVSELPSSAPMLSSLGPAT